MRYEENLATDKKNPKRLYAYVNDKKSVDCSITATHVGERTHTEKKAIAEALNAQFDSVFIKNEDDNIPPIQRLSSEESSISSMNI